jgi:DNA-binding NarL/FixJ family response regulator
MNNELLTIAIAEPSVIIRSGLAVALKRIPGFRIQTVEISTMDTLHNYLRLHKPEILIINPVFWGFIDIARLKEDTSNQELKSMALVYTAIDVSLLRNYDDTISIYESLEVLKEKLDRLIEAPSADSSDESNTLTLREKEIIVCVVKGLTNREIAQELFLSTHTVISHRRNIARKLEIHSTAGLTIFAIVNKLVELEEIKKNMLI